MKLTTTSYFINIDRSAPGSDRIGGKRLAVLADFHNGDPEPVLGMLRHDIPDAIMIPGDFVIGYFPEGEEFELGVTGDLEDGSESFTGRGANSVSDKTSYGNLTLDVEKAIDTNVNNPSSGLGDGRNKYRAVQAAAYTGKYAVYAQNKNYGSIENSSKGGRICWSDMQTGEQVKCVEVGSEGGHMDGLAYDSDRGCVLKTVSGGRLLVMDNNKMEIVGYSKIAQTHVGITYVPSIHMLVGYSNGGLVFYKYNQNQHSIELLFVE